MFFVLVTMLAASACKKEKAVGNTEVSVEQNIRIVNILSDKVYLRLYPSSEDYLYNTNPVLDTLLKYRDSVVLKFNSLDTKYYMDWFSEDYAYTNWGIVGFTSSPTKGGGNVPIVEDIEIDLQNLNEIKYLSSVRNLSSRLYYINGNDPETYWEAVNYTDALGKQAWDTLPAYSRYFRITLRKNMTSLCERMDASGNIISKEGKAFIGWNMMSMQLLVPVYTSQQSGRLYTVSARDAYNVMVKDILYVYLESEGRYTFKRVEKW